MTHTPKTRGQIVLLMLVFFAVFMGIAGSFISYLVTGSRAERVWIAQAQAIALAEGVSTRLRRLLMQTPHIQARQTRCSGPVPSLPRSR